MHLDFSRKSLLKCIRRILPNNQLCERWRPEYRQCGLPDRFHSPCTADFLKQGNEDLEKSLSPLHWKLNNKYPWSQRDGEGGSRARKGHCSVHSLLNCWAVPAKHKGGKERSPDTQPSPTPNLPCIANTCLGSTRTHLTVSWFSVYVSLIKQL